MGGLEDTCLWLCVVSLYRLRIVCALPPTYSPLLERRVYYRNVFHQERERERESERDSRVYIPVTERVRQCTWTCRQQSADNGRGRRGGRSGRASPCER